MQSDAEKIPAGDKVRTTIKIDPKVHAAGLVLVDVDRRGNFSVLLEALIEARWKDAFGSAPLPKPEINEAV